MITDPTGIELIPGNHGNDCPGNGEFLDKKGNVIECRCDECDFMMCCYQMQHFEDCNFCRDIECPRHPKQAFHLE